MPVSSPSYFPPSRGTDQIVGITAGQSQTGARVFLAGQSSGAFSTVSDMVLIGDNVAAGPITDSKFQGLTGVGSNCLASLINADPAITGASTTAYGYLAGNAMNYGNANVFIGDHAGQNSTGVASSPGSHNVIIGSCAAQNAGAVAAASYVLSRNVIIGSRAAQGALANTTNVALNVIIGYEAAVNLQPSLYSCVVMGALCLTGVLTAGNSGADAITAVGYGITGVQGTVTAGATLIGGNITSNTTDGSGNVVVGDTVSYYGTNNTIIGSNVQTGANSSANIVIGAFAGANMGAVGNVCMIETNLLGTRRGCFYADMNAGNVILGLSTPGTNRDFAGTSATNIVKILAGTAGNANPVGGGYFYFNATSGLKFVSPSGAITTLAPI